MTRAIKANICVADTWITRINALSFITQLSLPLETSPLLSLSLCSGQLLFPLFPIRRSLCSSSPSPSALFPPKWFLFPFSHHQLSIPPHMYRLLICSSPILPPMNYFFHQHHLPAFLFSSTDLLVVLLFSSLFALIFGQQNAYSWAPSPPTAPIYGPPAKTPSVSAYPPPVQYPPPQPPLSETSYGGCAVGEGGECPAVEKAVFPMPTCYLNKDGFMCCNKELENLMDNTYRNISKSRGGKWKRCNTHQVAVATQRNAEKHFGVDFETVVGAGDFAAMNYFNQDLNHFGICDARLDQRLIMNEKSWHRTQKMEEWHG